MDTKTLLVATPFSSPNYVYPASAYLARYLRRSGRTVAQADLSLETLLSLFSRRGLERAFEAAGPVKARLNAHSARILDQKHRYLTTVEPVIGYLQGRNPTLAYRICHRDFLPRGCNFEFNEGFDWYDGTGNTLPVHDRAKFIGTQYLYDIAGFVRDAIFPYFQITMIDRHHDDYVHRRPTFDKMYAELLRPPNVIDQLLIEALDRHLDSVQPDVVGVSVPFARNLYWALRIAKHVKDRFPKAVTVAGGGLFNTSMRTPREPRLFDFIDYLTLDDGERPLQHILELVEGKRGQNALKRTFFRKDDAVAYSDGSKDPDASHDESGGPDLTDYPVADYYGTLETVNVSQRLHSDSWWNQLTMAHGCYWKKCSFCDIHLSYIGDYHTAPAQNLVDKVEEAIAQTGQTGFHFVDEALPPKVMRGFAIEVLKRKLNISWFGMMRFDKTFTPELCRLLAASGMVAAFGGLEVASDRLLKLMKKGTTVEQVAVICKNLQDAGIRVHAFIMYGFPSQTAQETVDALDVVRQLFLNGLLTSASWAKFEVTPHSPVGRNPAEYGITLHPGPENAFLDHILGHDDPANDHERFTSGLQNALRCFGVGMHHHNASENWFDFPVPSVSIDRDLIAKILDERQRALAAAADADLRSDRRAIWLGPSPKLRHRAPWADETWQADLVFHGPQGEQAFRMPIQTANWLAGALESARPSNGGPVSIRDLELSYRQSVQGETPGNGGLRAAAAVPDVPGPASTQKRADDAVRSSEFQALLRSPEWRALRSHGLMLV